MVVESESKAGTSNSPQMVGSNIETWCGQFEMNIPFSGSSWDSNVFIMVSSCEWI